MIYQTVVALAMLAVPSMGRLFNEDPVLQKTMFDNFKREHGRSYKTMDEETHRFANFIANIRKADDRNDAELNAGGSAAHGITKFSDYTDDEFKGLLGSDPSLKKSEGTILTNHVYTGAATSVDWTGKYTTPVKDQGYCGSCWAFSATEQIESDAMRTLGTTYVLSPQQITSCDRTSLGCNGGWTEHAYNYVKGTAGQELNSDYPYTSYNGNTGTCQYQASKAKVGVDSYTTIKGETNMANYMLGTGPLSVCVDASSWNSYKGGIMSVCGQSVNHCVQAVGVNTATGGYWKVRNSWGTSWGESGYIRLAYGKNTCAITSDPTYVKVHKA